MKEMIDLLKSGDREDYLSVFVALPVILGAVISLWVVFE